MWHEAVHQGGAVAEERVQLFGGLNRRGRRRVELLPLHRHRAAARGGHPLRLARHLPEDTRVNGGDGSGWWGGGDGRPAHLFSPGVFGFGVKELIGSAPRLGQGPQHVTVGCRTDGTRTNDQTSARTAVLVGGNPCRPEAAGEEAGVRRAGPEQLQGQLRVLDVTVGQQQQVPDAAGGRQQAEGPQGPPQLSAAPYWSEALGRGGEGQGDAFRGFKTPLENCHRAKKAAEM